eukprot:431148_1
MTDSDANDISHDIAQRRECLIFGFVRDIQLILPKHWIIPKSIKLECLRYYWQETFIVSGSNITFDIKHNIITNTKTGWHQSSNTTFGEIYFGKASKYVFSWSFKILSCTAYIILVLTPLNVNIQRKVSVMDTIHIILHMAVIVHSSEMITLKQECVTMEQVILSQ